MCLDWGSNPQARYAPHPGIKPATFQLWDDAPTNGATPARAVNFFLIPVSKILAVKANYNIIILFNTVISCLESDERSNFCHI